MRSTKDLKEIVTDVRGGVRQKSNTLNLVEKKQYNTAANRIEEENDESYNF